MNDQENQTDLWTGGCACGAVRYVYEGQPVISLKCHCPDCKSWSGGGHLPSMFVWTDGLRLESGELRFCGVKGGSGKEIRRGWCPTCGSGILMQIDLIPTVNALLAASLDEPHRFVPEAEIWTQYAMPWDQPDPSLHVFERGFAHDFILPRLKRLMAG